MKDINLLNIERSKSDYNNSCLFFNNNKKLNNHLT